MPTTHVDLILTRPKLWSHLRTKTTRPTDRANPRARKLPRKRTEISPPPATIPFDEQADRGRRVDQVCIHAGERRQKPERFDHWTDLHRFHLHVRVDQRAAPISSTVSNSERNTVATGRPTNEVSRRKLAALEGYEEAIVYSSGNGRHRRSVDEPAERGRRDRLL